LTIPRSLLSRKVQMSATLAVLVRTGKKYAVRSR